MSLLRNSSENVNASANAIAALLNNGYARIYTGTQPATADTAASGTLLAELRFATTAFSTAASGVITAAAITPEDSALATGTATWFRTLKSDGVAAVYDDDVGLTTSVGLQLGSVAISSGAEVSITSLTYTVPKSSS